MFDHEEEDKDLASQVAKGQPKSDTRGEREDTPGPEASTKEQQTPESIKQNPSESPSSTTTEKSETSERKVIPESALPDKIVNPPTTQERK